MRLCEIIETILFLPPIHPQQPAVTPCSAFVVTDHRWNKIHILGQFKNMNLTEYVLMCESCSKEEASRVLLAATKSFTV